MGGRQGVLHGPLRAQILVMSQAVCVFGCPAFRSDCEDVLSEALVSAPHGGVANGWDTPPFAHRLWGCPRRFACLVALTPLLSEQIVRMSRARRWLQHPQGEPPWGIAQARSRPDFGDVSSGLPEKARTPQILQIPRKEINEFCLSGPSWDASRSSLGASWGPLGPS